MMVADRSRYSRWLYAHLKAAASSQAQSSTADAVIETAEALARHAPEQAREIHRVAAEVLLPSRPWPPLLQ